jgi:hypothetical protein
LFLLLIPLQDLFLNFQSLLAQSVLLFSRFLLLILRHFFSFGHRFAHHTIKFVHVTGDFVIFFKAAGCLGRVREVLEIFFILE